jgi:NitT/TauT family transport system permease protein
MIAPLSAAPASLLTRFIRFVLPPLLFFVAVILAWHGAVVAFRIEPYLLPKPGAVLQQAVQQHRELLRATAMTGAAALLGFLSSLAVGLLVAFVFSQSRWIQRAGYPYAIFFQTVPVVAIAPLIIIWFGSNFRSVVITSAIVSLFPIIANATQGLVDIDRSMRELFDVNNAGRIQRLFKLRLPSATPYIVAGAKTSSGLSVIGAIVGEFFAGFGQDRYGLGYLIFQANSQLRTDLMVAATIASTLLGLAIFGAVSLIGAILLRHWREI